MELDKKVAPISACLAIAVFGMTVLLASPAVQAKKPPKPPSDLENRVAELEATAAAVQAELDTINATISQLQTDLNNETATREAEVTQLDGRVTANESAVSTNTTAIADQESRISTNESDIVANSALIEDNTNQIDALGSVGSPVSVNANGIKIGAYLMTLGTSGFAPREVVVMNDNEYLFSICLDTPECAPYGDGSKVEGDLMLPTRNTATYIAYTTDDCTGQEYLIESQLVEFPGLGSLLKGSGYVFDNGGAIYYSPTSNQPIRDDVRSIKSLSIGSSCESASGLFGREVLYPVFPNDPTVTGVSTSSFDLPLSLGFE